MTSRERVLAALNHKETNHIPIDFGGHRSSGIMAIAYNKLKQHLGIQSGNIYVYDLIQQLAIVEEPILERFGIDTVELGRGFLMDDNDWQDWVLPDGTPCKIPAYLHVEKREDDWVVYNEKGIELGIQKKGCLYFEQTHFPMASRDMKVDDFSDLEEQMENAIWSAIAAPGAHLPFDKNGLKELSAKAKKLRESTDRAIIGLFGGPMFEAPQFMFGMEKYLLHMGMYRNQAIKYSEKLCAIYLKKLEKWIKAVGPYIDIVLFSDDLGSQKSLMISPIMYRDYFKPYHQKMCSLVKKQAEVKTLLHSCGSIEAVLDDLIEVGFDAVNPVQISCNNMGTDMLKEKYGDRLCFWGGGCDTQSILFKGSNEEITSHVKNQVAILKKRGGFVFQQVHNIMANIPPENIVKMFDAIERV
jgi:uroporphyrinogen decarboxylase